MSATVCRVRALLAQPDRRAALRSGSYVLERERVLYVGTPRAACTALKGLLLAGLGHDLAVFGDSPLPRTSAEALVHDRERFPAPSLADLDGPSLTRALTEDGWLRFCVVRNPYARVYSSWEDKLLLGDPALPGRFGPAGAFDVLDDAGRLDVRRSFASFVADLARRPGFYRSDPHFALQADVVMADDLPYGELVRLEQLADFVPRLRAHLVSNAGRDPGDLPRLNGGLGIDWRDAYDRATAAHVRELYGADFDRWGYDSTLPDAGADRPLLPPTAARLLARIRSMNDGLTALGALATRGVAAERDRDIEHAGRLRAERHAEELAREHARLVKRYETLAAEHEQLRAGWAALHAEHTGVQERLADLEARRRAFEARRAVRLWRRLQRAARRIRRRG